MKCEKKAKRPVKRSTADLFSRISVILESARTGIARTVNTTQVIANWLVGREIIEEEQGGKLRAKYGKAQLIELSGKLKRQYGAGYSVDNLEWFRLFYQTYPHLLDAFISDSSRRISGGSPISDALRRISAETSNDRQWEPGQLSPNLSWTHYRRLTRIESLQARCFYEIESIKNSWAARELERQINSLLYERIAMSKDKEGVVKLAAKGQEIACPSDIFKDPVIIEFLGLPESERLVESSVEQGLIDNLQQFLLELGKGFAFLARQERITLDGDHFYIDLVFYHAVLKCYVLIDLKVGKLTHGDLGQMQLYVNYYDQEKRNDGDNPSLGLVLCTDKNDAVVKYLLGPDQSRKIFTSRYKLHLPSEADLVQEIQRELYRS